MDNSICEFSVLQNPNRRYANTVNLVFFRAVPLTKHFQKYIDGLSNWRTYMKYYPDCQLQVFVDEHVLKEQSVVTLLKELNARVYVFQCPAYFIQDNFHLGLFATMVRFYPMFDVNTHALHVAHIQELEPDNDFVPMFAKLDKLGTMKHGASIVYTTSKPYMKDFVSNKYKFETFIYYPWIIAGRFSAYEKVPFKLFTNYLDDVNQGKTFYNIYSSQDFNRKPEHGNYSFGVDESFLNEVYLPFLISAGKTIGILTEFKPSYAVYYSLQKVKQNAKSQPILSYILNKPGTLHALLKEFDTLYYSNHTSEYANECADRFYQVLEKYPSWLGTYATDIILKLFKGYVFRSCLILVKHNQIENIIDLN